MVTTTQAYIYLDENRVVEETATCRKLVSLHRENMPEPDNPYDNSLTGLQEILLAGAATETIVLDSDCTYILLPVAGAVTCITGMEQRTFAAGQVIMVSAKNTGNLIVENPFTDNLVSFLMLTLYNNVPSDSVYMHIYDDVNEHVNTLLPICPEARQYNKNLCHIALGLFTGRGETMYKPEPGTKTAVTVFVVQGAFEVEGRLLHQGDTLTLRDTAQLDMEALSNQAILLLMETRLTKFGATHYLY
jgi:hypothetical protein